MGFSGFQSGDWQNFIYLALILTMLASSIFFRREFKFIKILKYLAIWSALGLAIIVVYSYRYEFSDFKKRILGELNPSVAQVGNSGEMTIDLSQDGHFYLDVKVNGVPMRFMIDTGASDIVIGIDEARKIGVDVGKLTFNKPYQTANGKSWGASVILQKLEVGNATFHNVSASVNNADMGTSLLGMSFLRQFGKYEFYRDRLVLYREN